MELINTSTDKLLRYRVQTGADVEQMKDNVGKVISVCDIIQNITQNQTGEDVTCTSLVTLTGEVYQTLSPTISDCCQSLYSIFKEELENGGVNVEIVEKKSNKGNRFLSLNVITKTE